MAPAYKLTYFDFSAMGEPIRFLFHYGGIEFEDIRIPMNKWPEVKPKMPFGQVPILEHNGKIVNQTVPICTYIAKQIKFTGKDDWEDLEIAALANTVDDFRLQRYKYLVAEESQKADIKNMLLKEIVPYYYERFNKSVTNGYLVGGHLTWADMFFVCLSDFYSFVLHTDLVGNYPNLIAVKNNVISIPEIKNWMDKRPQDKL